LGPGQRLRGCEKRIGGGGGKGFAKSKAKEEQKKSAARLEPKIS
jgi:hypothetical protein